MRAIINSGLGITLLKKDNEEGEKEGRIECRIQQFNKPKVVIHIVDKLQKYIQSSLEEQGFHITTTPKYGGPEKRKQYDIYLTKEIFTKLTNPKKDPIIDGGYFGSRCLYDRVDIKYLGI